MRHAAGYTVHARHNAAAAEITARELSDRAIRSRALDSDAITRWGRPFLPIKVRAIAPHTRGGHSNRVAGSLGWRPAARPSGGPVGGHIYREGRALDPTKDDPIV